MCNSFFGGCGNSCTWVILLIIILVCCCGGGNDCDRGCGNNGCC